MPPREHDFAERVRITSGTPPLCPTPAPDAQRAGDAYRCLAPEEVAADAPRIIARKPDPHLPLPPAVAVSRLRGPTGKRVRPGMSAWRFPGKGGHGMAFASVELGLPVGSMSRGSSSSPWRRTPLPATSPALPRRAASVNWVTGVIRRCFSSRACSHELAHSCGDPQRIDVYGSRSFFGGVSRITRSHSPSWS